jgi:hypothetical protein
MKSVPFRQTQNPKATCFAQLFFSAHESNMKCPTHPPRFVLEEEVFGPSDHHEI